MLDGEEKTINKAVSGQADAFGLLYDHYHSRIYRFTLLKVGRREDAEDLTHQVFLSAWQNIGSYKNLGFPFSSWLYQIARNQIIDYYRTKKSESRLDEIDPEHFVVSASIDFNLDKSFEIQNIMEAIRKLKPEYQDVLIMRFVEDLSPKEIAGALGKSEGAIKLVQHRAIKQLKETLRIKEV